LNNAPLAGDLFEAVEDLDIARERANGRAEVLHSERISAKAGEGKVTLSSIAASVSSGKQVGIDTHELNAILKVDYQVAKILGHNLILLFIFLIHF
jgi:translation initiation factor IF-2